MKDIARFNAMKDKRNIVSLNLAQREKENHEEDALRLERINARYQAEGKKPLKSLDDLPKDYKEPDPYLDETVKLPMTRRSWKNPHLRHRQPKLTNGITRVTQAPPSAVLFIINLAVISVVNVFV